MSNPDDVVLRVNQVTQALNWLALETKDFIDPAAAPRVIEELIAGLHWLQHVIENLALAHQRYGYPADTDLTQAEAEPASVTEAVRALRQARDTPRHLRAQLERALRHSYDLDWPPPRRRWIDVKSWEGWEAEEALDVIDRLGPHLALRHLLSWDRGDGTTQDALEDGRIHDGPPDGPDDQTTTHDGYALTYNRTTRQVSLLREHETPPDPVRSLRPSADRTPHRDRASSPFFTPPATSPSSRGMSL